MNLKKSSAQEKIKSTCEELSHLLDSFNQQSKSKKSEVNAPRDPLQDFKETIQRLKKQLEKFS